MDIGHVAAEAQIETSIWQIEIDMLQDVARVS